MFKELKCYFREVWWLLFAFALLDFIFLAVYMFYDVVPVYSYGDNKFYIKIAQTFYVDNPKLSLWFPFYPALIRLFYPVFSDWRIAAHVVGRIFHVLTIFAFYIAVRDRLKHPKRVTLLFTFFPMEWPFTALVGLSEPVFMFFAVLSYHFFIKQKHLSSFAMASLATLAHDSGVLLFAIYLPFLIKNKQPRQIGMLMMMPAVVVGLFSYYWFIFGDFFIYMNQYSKFFDIQSPLDRLTPYGSYIALLYSSNNPVAGAVTFILITIYIISFVFFFLKRDWFHAWWVFVFTSFTSSLTASYVSTGLISLYGRLLIRGFPVVFFLDRIMEKLGSKVLIPIGGLYLFFAYTYPFYKVPNSFAQAFVNYLLSLL